MIFQKTIWKELKKKKTHTQFFLAFHARKTLESVTLSKKGIITRKKKGGISRKKAVAIQRSGLRRYRKTWEDESLYKESDSRGGGGGKLGRRGGDPVYRYNSCVHTHTYRSS